MRNQNVKLYHMVSYMVIEHMLLPHVTISGIVRKEWSELERWHNRDALMSPLTPHRSQTSSNLLILFHPKVESVRVCCGGLGVGGLPEIISRKENPRLYRYEF